jgi:hypothetical protein
MVKPLIENAATATADEEQEKQAYIDELKAENEAEGEPKFTLRGQDAFADIMTQQWVHQASQTLGRDHPKIISAQRIADRMVLWPSRKMPD